MPITIKQGGVTTLVQNDGATAGQREGITCRAREEKKRSEDENYNCFYTILDIHGHRRCVSEFQRAVAGIRWPSGGTRTHAQQRSPRGRPRRKPRTHDDDTTAAHITSERLHRRRTAYIGVDSHYSRRGPLTTLPEYPHWRQQQARLSAGCR